MAMATLLHWIQVASILLGKMPPSLDGELLMMMVSSIKIGDQGEQHAQRTLNEIEKTFNGTFIG